MSKWKNTEESIIDVGHVCCMDFECEIEDFKLSTDNNV